MMILTAWCDLHAFMEPSPDNSLPLESPAHCQGVIRQSRTQKSRINVL